MSSFMGQEWKVKIADPLIVNPTVYYFAEPYIPEEKTMARLREPGFCPDCGVLPNQPHQHGCDVERCRLCGGQAISCDCVYKLANMNMDTMERDFPEVYKKGPTQEMYNRYDEEVNKFGGRLVWTGIWPGVVECREFGWYSKMIPGKPGWHACSADDPEASEDLNRLVTHATWSPKSGRYVLLTTVTL